MGYAFVLAMVFIHYPTTLFLCAPAILLFAFDLALRFRNQCTRRCQVGLRHFEASGITEVSVLPLSPRYREAVAATPGQFVTIHLGELDLACARQLRPFPLFVELHPFSISTRQLVPARSDYSQLSPTSIATAAAAIVGVQQNKDAISAVRDLPAEHFRAIAAKHACVHGLNALHHIRDLRRRVPGPVMNSHRAASVVRHGRRLRRRALAAA